MPVTISDFAHGQPQPASSDEAARDELPWLNIFTEAERAIIRRCEALIWPDRPITRRLTRHVLTTAGGHRLQALKTLDEAFLYAQAQDWETVGLVIGGRVIPLNPASSAPPSLSTDQMGLFDGEK